MAEYIPFDSIEVAQTRSAAWWEAVRGPGWQPGNVTQYLYGRRQRTGNSEVDADLPDGVDYAVKAQPGERGRRDLVVFTLLYSGGLRVSEAASLRIEDLDLERAMLRVAYGKGNKDRMIDLRPSDVELLRDWVRARTEGWLFPGQDGHLSARVIQQYAREYGRAAGLRRMHPHLLRHSCAEHYLLEGVPITFVQQRLGHASLATTGIYTQLADVERARIARSVELAV